MGPRAGGLGAAWPGRSGEGAPARMGRGTPGPRRVDFHAGRRLAAPVTFGDTAGSTFQDLYPKENRRGGFESPFCCMIMGGGITTSPFRLRLPRALGAGMDSLTLSPVTSDTAARAPLPFFLR
nr:uncharacterized protein LOC106824820 isoform X2 [Equus asinus]